ncbi:hypothetical protein DB347_19675 [Opitutaceae bacterium EW11]|nr:hypothetical protein DB347_19675 [Opitutaceae bacterium EW11]
MESILSPILHPTAFGNPKSRADRTAPFPTKSMKQYSSLLGAILAFAPVSLLAQTAPQAAAPKTDSTQEETIELPAFTVSDQLANRYRATDTMSAARIRSSILDTPVSINVITQDFIQDIGATSILDASRYFAGISAGRLSGTNGISDRHLSRGFENSGRTVDNMSTAYQAQINPELIERVEIVKGPNAILAPTGSPGGSLNVITKSPSFKPSYSVIGEVGRYSANKATVDLTGPITDALAYRIVSSYLDSDTFVHGGNIKSFDFNPSVLYKIGKNTTLKVKANYVDWEAHGNAAVPGGIGISYLVPVGSHVSGNRPSQRAAGTTYDGWGMQPDWALRKDKVKAIAAELVTAITDSINMRVAASTNTDSFMEDDIYTGGGNYGGNFYDPYTGIYTPLLKWSLDTTTGNYVPTTVPWSDPRKTDVSADRTIAEYDDTMFQHDFAGRWSLNGVTVSPIAGWMYQNRHGTNWERQKYLGQYDALKFPRDPLPHPARSEYDNKDTDITETKKLLQFYAYTQLGFLDDRVLTTLGWSRIRVDNKTVDHNNNDSVATLKGPHDTYAASLLVKVTPNASLYYGYSANAQATDAGRGAPPRWRDGKQHEFGVKSEFLDKRISASAAYFRINQNNVSTPNPLRQLDPSQPGTLYQDITNNGIELEIVGGITKDLSVIASYTSMHYRDTLGRRVRNVPDEMSNLLLNYQIDKQWSVFAGLQHTGDMAAETAPTSPTPLGVVKQVAYYTEPFTIVNAGGSFRWNRLRVTLDIENVLDTKALYQASGAGAVVAYPSINPKLTVRYEF